jgi:hypothetical protein
MLGGMPGTLRGVIIGESIRLGASFEGVTLRVSAIRRFDAPPEPQPGPAWWTFIEFEADAIDGEPMSRILAECLDDSSPWYASFRSDDEMFVVFAGRQFRYPFGDAAARGDVEGYARSLGVPNDQLDWET